MKKGLIITSVIALFVIITSCMPGSNELTSIPTLDGELAGFWSGLWHGFIVLFSFIVSLFSDTVQVYEVHNIGGWYDFGFLLGVMIFFGGSGNGASRRKCCK